MPESDLEFIRRKQKEAITNRGRVFEANGMLFLENDPELPKIFNSIANLMEQAKEQRHARK